MKADHAQVAKLLVTAKGQIEGILKMIEDDRYCIDVSTQILAATAILKKANQKVLEAHLDSCVLESFSDDGQKKVAEIVSLLHKMNG